MEHPLTAPSGRIPYSEKHKNKSLQKHENEDYNIIKSLFHNVVASNSWQNHRTAVIER